MVKKNEIIVRERPNNDQKHLRVSVEKLSTD